MSKFKIDIDTDNECGGAADDLAQLGARLMTLSLNGASEFMKQSSSFFLSSLPKTGSCRGETCCEIPEKSCPPHCTREIEWEGSVGEVLRTMIKVVNTSDRTQAFSFTSTPFTSAAGPTLPVRVTPSSANLTAGQSTTVVAEFEVTDAIALAGPLEDAEVLIQGAFVQRVCMKLHAHPIRVAHCTVEQGDPPVRIRAHQWWDHFQCTEPCVVEVKVRPTSPVVSTVYEPRSGTNVRAKKRS